MRPEALVIDTILVPVDMSRGADAALQTALPLAEKLGAEIHVLNVWQPPPYVVPEMVVTVPGGATMAFDDFMAESTKKDLERFIAPYRRGSPVRITAHIDSGIPKQLILRFAAKNSFDLIVMGTHGHTGLMHMLMGSVAEHVVRNQTCPVITVRPTESPSSED